MNDRDITYDELNIADDETGGSVKLRRKFEKLQRRKKEIQRNRYKNGFNRGKRGCTVKEQKLIFSARAHKTKE